MDTANMQEQWLKEMEEKSRAKQLKFIGHISSKLRRPMVNEAPKHPFRGAPDFWNAYEWTEQERIERFTENFKSVGGHVERLSSMEDVQRFITDKANELDAKYIIRQNEPGLAALGLEERLPEAKISVWNTDTEENWKARSAEADIGVVLVDHAAAYTSSMVVLSSKDKGRSVSLLPTVLIAIIPLDRLKTRLGEVMEKFDAAGRENLPAGIHFISGPSRSSDIENDLTIGVHGPGIVYALLVG
ncbi:L-lactate dehydrogenase complex protein LldG [Cohnella sp. SGD-V74]|jgi:L-lactate dehydrogenase complex protein LldG|uniref:LutC/YkgG family protein n=1 Tax=unclassified Cohnella TaxID=2636738 RepID=UPI000D4A5DF3|nr:MULTISPECIES: LUD domain-containing protein [unclassified Cohnella]PRX73478.1 L-lactate dehydrogenase complex protein LldG [Cohnella sp. SGD-V74]